MIYTPTFWAMAVANFSQTASFSAFFLLPLYLLDHGGNRGDVGMVMGIFALTSAICRPWISEMIDRIGRKRSFTLGNVIMVAAPLAYLGFADPLGSGYLWLLLLRGVHGIGMAICFTAAFTYMADILPVDRFNEGIGMFGISGLLGAAVGPLAAETILRQAGYPGLFVAAAGFALLSMIVHLPLTESHIPTMRRSGPTFFTLLRRGKFVIIALLSLLFGLGLAATSNFVAPLAAERHLGAISPYYLCYSAGAIATRFVGGRLADHFGENRLLPWGIGMFVAGLAILPMTHGTLLLNLAGIFAGAGHGLLFPILNTLAVRGEPGEIRGKATGIFTGGIDTGIFAGSLILGYIGEWFGLPVLFWAAGAGMAGGLLLFGFRPPKSDKTR
ncbi:MAG: MFS transporter [Desulfuromonadales bacterium]